MNIDDQIRDERLQYDINKEAAKISALLSGKLDKCEYLTSKEILPSNQKKKKKKKKNNKISLRILPLETLLKHK